jgi:hypothetical protein
MPAVPALKLCRRASAQLVLLIREGAADHLQIVQELVLVGKQEVQLLTPADAHRLRICSWGCDALLVHLRQVRFAACISCVSLLAREVPDVACASAYRAWQKRKCTFITQW